MKEPRQWNDFQLAIFRNIAEGKGNTFVRARAGCAKTTTCIEGLNHVPRGMSALMCAFNKSIAEELELRAPQGVTVSTLHSYGFRALKSEFGWKLDVNKHKVFQLVDEIPELVNRDKSSKVGLNNDLLARTIPRLVSLAKGQLAWTAEEIENIIWNFNIQLPSELFSRAISHTIDVLHASKKSTSSVDFDDMVWLPVVLGLRTRKFDRVFIDEAQDLNPAQIELALMACLATGRILVLADDKQAIYGFTGANEDNVEKLIDRLRAKVMPLPVTYRCAVAIVEEAKKYVPDYTAAPNAREGSIHNIHDDRMLETARAGDFVISRSNAPLVTYCLRFLRDGVKARISGRDIGASLVALIKSSGQTTVVGLTEWIQAWGQREIARLEAKKPPQDPSIIIDKMESIDAFCEGAESVDAVIARMEGVFSDTNDAGSIILSTVHKAKGLESNRAFLLTWTFKPERGGEDANLYYVAVTRARETLYRVHMKRKDKKVVDSDVPLAGSVFDPEGLEKCEACAKEKGSDEDVSGHTCGYETDNVTTQES